MSLRWDNIRILKYTHRCPMNSIIRNLALVFLTLGLATGALAQNIVNGGFENPQIQAGTFFKNYSNTIVNIPGWQLHKQTGYADGSGSWGTGGHSFRQYGYVQSGGYESPSSVGDLAQTVTGFTVGLKY